VHHLSDKQFNFTCHNLLISPYCVTGLFLLLDLNLRDAADHLRSLLLSIALSHGPHISWISLPSSRYIDRTSECSHPSHFQLFRLRRPYGCGDSTIVCGYFKLWLMVAYAATTTSPYMLAGKSKPEGGEPDHKKDLARRRACPWRWMPTLSSWR
jgi:hypothetical protein